jgi:hypothetical protein
MARFLVNALLVFGRYRWTVIRLEDRVAYLAALDRANIRLDIGPFAGFIAERVRIHTTNKDKYMGPEAPERSFPKIPLGLQW